MKKFMLLIAAAAAMMPAAEAATTWTITGKEYAVDTLQSFKSGPGTVLTELRLTNGSTKMKVWVTTTDLTDPNVVIKSINGSPIRSKNMMLTDMVTSRKGDGNVYFLGVNADLFSTLGPIGTSICDGELLKTAKVSTGWSAVGVEATDGKLYFGTPKVTFSAKLNGVVEYAPDLVNVPRGTGETVLFTNRWSSTTTFWPLTGDPESPDGIHIVLKPKDGKLHSDGPTECTVQSAPVKGSSTVSIPSGCFVLSSNIASRVKDLGLMKAGDTYTITPTGISLGTDAYNMHSFKKCVELTGGDPMLVVKGERRASYPTMPDYKVRRPRTAIGTDQSGTTMMLAIIDGDNINSGVSAGANADEWADIMLAIGCYNALNFDGGGSTAMYTDCFGIVDKPSGTGGTWNGIKMRPVRNGWFVATPDKNDTELASIEFVDPHLTCDKGYTYTPKFYGYNKAGLLINKNVTGVVLTAPTALGAVSADGKSITMTGDGTYRLTAVKGNMECHIAVRSGDYTANAGSGVDDVTVADGEDIPAEYYTLQGIRVAEPAAGGVYIVRKGSKAYKVAM